MTVLTQDSWELRNSIALSPFQTLTFRLSTSSRSSLLGLKNGISLRWQFDLGSGFWIASDAPSSLARVEASESPDLNLVPGSQGTDDAVKYGADDEVGVLQ